LFCALQAAPAAAPGAGGDSNAKARSEHVACAAVCARKTNICQDRLGTKHWEEPQTTGVVSSPKPGELLFVPAETPHQVSGNSLAIYISKRIFYQDRLGTNKGKTRKQCVSLSYQVENLQDTIALSGNFIDANNLQRSMLHLQKESRAGHEPSVRLFEGLAGVAARAQTQRRGLHAHTWDEPTWDRDPAKEAGGAEEGGQGRAGGGGVRDLPWREFKRGRPQ
jgi:hypothetical protein